MSGGDGVLNNFLDICFRFPFYFATAKTTKEWSGPFGISSQVMGEASQLIPKSRPPQPHPRVVIVSAFIHHNKLAFHSSTNPEKRSKLATWESNKRNSSQPSVIFCHSDLLKMIPMLHSLALLEWYFCREILRLHWFRIELMREPGGMDFPSTECESNCNRPHFM